MPANYVLLQRVTLTATAASVTLNSIPQTGYTDLKIVISGRDSSSANTSNAGYSFTVYPNGASTNITQRSFFANGSTVSSYSDTQMYTAIEMNADTANAYNNVEIYCHNYTSANPKSFSIDSVTEHNAAGAAIRMASGLWNSTAAITSLQFNAYSTWMVGSSFSIYGIANTTVTPKISSKAYGGDIIKSDGTYWYHAFLSTNLFKPQVNLTCDILAIAGGGGGGADAGGGGGAGGVVYLSSQALTFTSPYSVVVGAGGVGSGAAAVTNTSGNNSFVGTLTQAIGGGKGSSYVAVTGNAGGSGGGGQGTSGAGGAGTSGQGNAGGSNTVGSSAAGGGGAGAAGSSATVGTSGANGGNGGNGTNTYSSWATATGTGANSGYFAGGGGGGGHSTSTTLNAGGTGGLGGGGVGGNYSNNTAARNVPTAGTANTGSGGGGDGWFAQGGKAGGSGIVIIRYPV